MSRRASGLILLGAALGGLLYASLLSWEEGALASRSPSTNGSLPTPSVDAPVGTRREELGNSIEQPLAREAPSAHVDTIAQRAPESQPRLAPTSHQQRPRPPTWPPSRALNAGTFNRNATDAELSHAGGFPFLMILGASKGGSTFLFECLEHAFHPRVVCGRDEAQTWTRPRCGDRRFLLPALRMSIIQRVAPFIIRVNTIKENYVLTKHMYRGPDTFPERELFYRGPQLPLALWEVQNLRVWSSSKAPDVDFMGHALNQTTKACASLMDNRGCPLREFRDVGRPYAWHWKGTAREGEACGFYRGASHSDLPPLWRVSTASMCASSLHNRSFSDVRAFAPLPEDTPAHRPWASRLVPLDGCPYNLGSAQAPQLLRQMLRTAEASRYMRFIVLVRDPVHRAFSEWQMTDRWKGQMHRGGSFWAHAQQQIGQLQTCAGAHLDALVNGTATAEVFNRLYPRCIDADYYSYIRNSLYALHLRSWFRFFPPESFLVLETERMAKTAPLDLMERVARFARLFFSRSALEAHPAGKAIQAKCAPKPAGARSPNLKEDKTLNTAVDADVRRALERFFFYDAALPRRLHMLASTEGLDRVATFDSP